MAGPIEGGCLCGAFRFRIQARLGDVRLCHCKLCRKANGSAFSANSRILRSGFVLLTSMDTVTEYESSPGAWKAFCSVCGSPCYSRVDWDPDGIRVRLGTIDDDVMAKIVAHVWVGSKAPWDRICDDLPQFDQADTSGQPMA